MRKTWRLDTPPTNPWVQSFDRTLDGAEDAKYFQPEQEPFLQELAKGRGGGGCVRRYRVRGARAMTNMQIVDVLRFKSLMSEFATASGKLYMFLASVQFIRSRQLIKSCKW